MQRMRNKPQTSSRLITRSLELLFPVSQVTFTLTTYEQIGKGSVYPFAPTYQLLLILLEYAACTVSAVNALNAALGNYWNGQRGFTKSQYCFMASLVLSSVTCFAIFNRALLRDAEFERDLYYFAGMLSALGTLLNQGVEFSATLFYANKHHLSLREAFEELNAPECSVM